MRACVGVCVSVCVCLGGGGSKENRWESYVRSAIHEGLDGGGSVIQNLAHIIFTPNIFSLFNDEKDF